MLRKDLPPHAAGGISLFHLRGDTVAVEDDPLGEATRFRLDAQSSVRAGGFTVKKHPIAIKIFLLLVLSVVVAIVYGVRGIHDARVQRETACYRANVEKLNSLEASTAAINTEVEEIQRDQDVIDQLDGTDDEAVIQRRSRMLDGVRLKLTKVNKDRAEGQRRTEQIQAELSNCLAGVK